MQERRTTNKDLKRIKELEAEILSGIRAYAKLQKAYASLAADHAELERKFHRLGWVKPKPTKKKKVKKKRRRPTRLDKINDREQERLGSKGTANTKAFWQKQKFGAASGVRHIDPADYEGSQEV